MPRNNSDATTSVLALQQSMTFPQVDKPWKTCDFLEKFSTSKSNFANELK